jgi:Tol biopolymer transport system component
MSRTAHVLFGVFFATLLLFSVVGSGFSNPNWSDAYATFPNVNGKIVFTSSRDGGNWNIYTMNSDGSGITQLTDSSDPDYYPSWSPDAGKIAFFREGTERGLFVMNADGTGITQLTTSVDRNPDWSPDGTKIAVSRLDQGSSKIFVINSDGSGETLLAGASSRDYDPSWSPDGAKIAFVVRTGDNGIYVMNSDGTGAAKLANGEEPDWSPDGTEIVFSSGNIIRVIDASGGGNQIPLTDSGYDSYPSWSPDGTKIVFQKAMPDQIQQWELYIMNSDGSGLMNLSSDGPVDFFADFGPQPRSQQSNLTVKSQDTNGNAVSRLWTVLYDGNGNVLKTGFTPTTFALNNGQKYSIRMGNFGSYSFAYWLDDKSSANPRSISINTSTQLTAVYTTTASSFPVIHMSDTTASAGYGVYSSKPTRAEYVTSTSQLVGDKIDSITLKLKRVGTISGTAIIGIFDNSNNVKKPFGTINVGTLTTTYADYEFHLTGSELYTIQSGDRIGIKYTGGSTTTWVAVMIDLNASDPFDGKNSYAQYYQGSWLSNADRDMYMILKQTHG